MKSTYFYRVTGFLKNWQTGQSFHDDKDFTGPLPEARQQAVDHYLQKLNSIEGKENLLEMRFTDPADIGKAPIESSFSYTLLFVETLDGEEYEYPIAGEDPEECEQSQETERLCFEREGLTPPPTLLEL